MHMRNVGLVLEYDGTHYHGWQFQVGVPTIQRELERALQALTRTPTTCRASSRTDAGVHALGQVVQFYTASPLKPNLFVRALNAHLPRDIRVLEACDMPQAWNPTLDARSKRYRYVIDNRRWARPFLLNYAWHVSVPLDVAAMQRAAAPLLGRHDFRSFETEWPNRTSSVRTIIDLRIQRTDDTVTIEVEADGFLYNMVRCIAGSLVWVGKGNRTETWIREILAAEDRRAAGPNAPPGGLFLVSVQFANWPPTRDRP